MAKRNTERLDNFRRQDNERKAQEHRQRLAAKIRAEFPSISQKRAERIAEIFREDLQQVVKHSSRT